MIKKELVIVMPTADAPLTLDELCEICNLPSADIHEFISYEIVHPLGAAPQEWKFDLVQVKRLKVAIRLKRDLEINMPGVAMILDLLEEINQLRTRAHILEKHYRHITREREIE